MKHYGRDVIENALCEMRDGKNASTVAREVGTSKKTVTRWCAKAGIELRHGAQKRARPFTNEAVSDAPHKNWWPIEKVEEALELVIAGHTASWAALKIGAPAQTVARWCREANIGLSDGRPSKAVSRRDREGRSVQEILAAPKEERTSPRSRLTIQDRAAIQEGIRAGRSARDIARDLGYAHTTISREIKRGSQGGVYHFSQAHRRAECAAKRPRAHRLDTDAVLRAYVVMGLNKAWSPRQIAQRMKLEFPDDEEMRVSHESIYQALYVQGKGALRYELSCEQALRSGRTCRKPRSRLPERHGHKRWVEGCEISKRPAEVEDRAIPGHWEGDLVIGGNGRSCLVTLVERKTRYLEMRRLLCHESKTVVDLLIEMVGEVPEGIQRVLMSTLTWDQGVEMALHASFTEATGFKVYFCDPHSPWQKGTNENTNGLIRQFFPKGTEFSDVSDEEVKRVQDLLNGRPRETLGWKTPAEAICEVLSQAS